MEKLSAIEQTVSKGKLQLYLITSSLLSFPRACILSLEIGTDTEPLLQFLFLRTSCIVQVDSSSVFCYPTKYNVLNYIMT